MQRGSIYFTVLEPLKLRKEASSEERTRPGAGFGLERWQGSDMFTVLDLFATDGTFGCESLELSSDQNIQNVPSFLRYTTENVLCQCVVRRYFVDLDTIGQVAQKGVNAPVWDTSK